VAMWPKEIDRWVREFRMGSEGVQSDRRWGMDVTVEKDMAVYISKKVIRNNGSRRRLLNRIVVARIAMSTGADANQ
jgi:hypothetical protein